MWTKEYWKAMLERVVIGAASAMLTVTVVGDGTMNAFDADWQSVAGIGLGGAFVTFLAGLVGTARTGNGPSNTRVEQVVVQ